ncbi:MAG TPA: dolichyl-phosphate beta-glucosyltransferase, partial [Candidatus Obscuribacterales bacterium]
PAYNEENRLPATLSSVHGYLSGLNIDFEILVVDDGSTDGTAKVVTDFASNHEGVTLISFKPNRGKGHAVRIGMLAAKGDLLLLDDADGASPIGEFKRLEDAISKGADIAIGSRNKPDPETRVNAHLHRKHMGNTFNIIVQWLILPGIYDTQCGFKLFKREIGRELFSVSSLGGYAFDVEILYLARVKGYKIAEVAINWSNVTGSKVNIFTDPFRMLIDVFKIVMRRNKYNQLLTAYETCSAGKNE